MIKFTKLADKLPPKDTDLLCSLGNGEALFTCYYDGKDLFIFDPVDLTWDTYLYDDDIEDEFYNETLGWIEIDKVNKLFKF